MLLCNIETRHIGVTDLFKQGAISMDCSFIQGTRTDVDKTIVDTFMCHLNPAEAVVLECL